MEAEAAAALAVAQRRRKTELTNPPAELQTLPAAPLSNSNLFLSRLGFVPLLLSPFHFLSPPGRKMLFSGDAALVILSLWSVSKPPLVKRPERERERRGEGADGRRKTERRREGGEGVRERAGREGAREREGEKERR